MPRGCLYPQDLNEVEILDDGTLNPKRCPYRTRWKPYLTSANHLCCQKHYVGKHNRANSRDRWTPKTHINFLDDRRPQKAFNVKKGGVSQKMVNREYVAINTDAFWKEGRHGYAPDVNRRQKRKN